MNEPLLRDIGRVNLSDKPIIRIINGASGEQIASFFHDGSVDLPEIGKTLELEHVYMGNEKPEDAENQPEFEKLGEYKVVDMSYKYALAEWANEEDEQVDQIFSISTILVEGSNENDQN